MQNGQQKQLPAVAVGWDAEAMQVSINAHPSLQNLNFLLALLGMAQRKVEGQLRVQEAVEFQRQQQEALQAEMIRKTIRHG